MSVGSNFADLALGASKLTVTEDARGQTEFAKRFNTAKTPEERMKARGNLAARSTLLFESCLASNCRAFG
jgi:hypothetical protein